MALAVAAVSAVVLSPSTAALYPGDVPPAFAVTLINGSTFAWAPPTAPAHVAPLIVLAYNANSSLHRFMWADDASVDAFLSVGAKKGSANYLVVSANAARDLAFVKARFDARVALLPSHAARQAWLARVAFAADPITSLSGAAFMQPLLQVWNSTAPVINALVGSPTHPKPLFSFGRIDARYDFLPGGSGLFGNATLELAYLGAACNQSAPAANVTGRVVLVELNSQCDPFAQAVNAIALNAIGMLAYDPTGQSMPEINCVAAECDNSLYGQFFAATIEAKAGAKLKTLLLSTVHVAPTSHVHIECRDDDVDLLPRASAARFIEPLTRCNVQHAPLVASASSVFIQFANPTVLGDAFAIDGGNLRLPSVLTPVLGVREVGVMLFPSLVFYAWADQWLTFVQAQDRHIETLVTKSQSSLIVPTLTGEQTGGVVTTYKNVSLPSASKLLPFNKLFLELELNCWKSNLDRECPIWDRIVSVYVDCGSGSLELGRWINQFRRQNGRWLTDASPWLPALRSNVASASNVCTFSINIYTIDNRFWAPHLNLIFVEDLSIPITPLSIVPLWPYGYKSFNASYASLFPTVPIAAAPSGVQRIELVSIISGHGSDSENCAEFCNQTHTFFIQSSAGGPVKSFSNVGFAAGTEFGCAEQSGLLPNGHGTWLYGRGNWCNGRQVEPMVWDASLLLQGGQVWFNGTTNGHAPNGSPNGNAAYIDFEAFLTLWG